MPDAIADLFRRFGKAFKLLGTLRVSGTMPASRSTATASISTNSGTARSRSRTAT